MAAPAPDHTGPTRLFDGSARVDARGFGPSPLGTPSRVSEVLSGKRDLSMTMIKRLRDRFHVPADLLIPHTPRKRTAA